MAKYKKPKSRIEAWDRINELGTEAMDISRTLHVIEANIRKVVAKQGKKQGVGDMLDVLAERSAEVEAELNALRNWLDAEGQFTDV